MKFELKEYKRTYKRDSAVKEVIWFIVSRLMFETRIPLPSQLKVVVLRLFGAEIGKSVVIKPSVKIKYPWQLVIGDFCWVGECVWLDNLGRIAIGSNCCISQGAYFCTGNHDYKSASFDLRVGDIYVGDSTWIGAKAVLCPGVTVPEGVILAASSVLTKSIKVPGVYQGNPAVLKRVT